MRAIPDAFAARLSGSVTTLCTAWTLRLADGRVLGFTDHDRDLVLDGITHAAASGFAASGREEEAGLGAATSSVTGGFSSDAIREEELAAGRFDGALIDVWRLDWTAPEQRVLIARQEIGEVSRSGNRFEAELRGIGHRLNQPQGRLYMRRCSAAFGDGACGLDAGRFSATGTVAEGSDRSRLLIDMAGTAALAPDRYRLGRLSLTTASGAAMTADIDSAVLDAQAAKGRRLAVQLFLPLAADPQPGAAATLTEGCDKSFETCRNRFNNQLNFRGFPQMPGPDFAYAPASGEGIHDGGALYP